MARAVLMDPVLLEALLVVLAEAVLVEALKEQHVQVGAQERL